MFTFLLIAHIFIYLTGVTAATPSLTPAPVSTTPLLGFGAQFKKPDGAWECDVCCVQNKGADQACVACQTLKPGAKVEPKCTYSCQLPSLCVIEALLEGFVIVARSLILVRRDVKPELG